ncbi:MarR family transcriptional regulator [Desulfovibrio sp. OttesenSCG-928-G15]|nr:MarR family transcriptional regulator [Desulfovibrio sp. OttesenSCG-928-G15]
MYERYYDVDKSLGYLTITTNRLMSANLRKRLLEAEIDITAEQWGILAQLWNNGSIAQDELANAICVDKSSLSRVLDVLERRGLVIRKRAPSDARRKVLYPTKEAEKLRTKCKEVADECSQRLMAGVDPDEMDCCLRVLTQIKQNLRAISD